MRDPDDEVVPMTMLGDDGGPAPTEPTPVERGDGDLPWTTMAMAASAIVAALALCVVAWAEVGQRRAAERQTCVQEAQVIAFALSDGGDDPREQARDRFAACGVDVPTEE